MPSPPKQNLSDNCHSLGVPNNVIAKQNSVQIVRTSSGSNHKLNAPDHRPGLLIRSLTID